MATIEELLTQEEDRLLFITRRLFVFEAFTAQLERATRGKPFRIWHGSLWMMILDSRDAHVIHFGSWLKSMYSGGGFFGQLQAHHLRSLPRKWRRLREAPNSLEARLLEPSHDEAFAELFPGNTEPFPKPAAVEALKQRFISTVSPVIEDRHANRAHPYEGTGRASASAKMLNVAELRQITDFAQRILNRLRLVALSSTLAHVDMNPTSSEEFGEELVDTILVGSKWRSSVVKGDLPRDVFYDRLHARHDALNKGDPRLFNDNLDEETA